MNKIKKFFEQYNLDVDSDSGIAEEYVKLIISTYIDKQNDGVTLEKAFIDVITGDELDDSHVYIIKNELQDFLYNLYEDAKKIREVVEIDANKYNL
jgi:hypothetical protein